MLNRETEQKLSVLAQRVWAGRRGDRTLEARLLRDPTAFLLEHGIAIPANLEVQVSVEANVVSFRFRPRKPAGDAAEPGGYVSAITDGSQLFRFEFEWTWD
jgi:hypothetical protein